MRRWLFASLVLLTASVSSPNEQLGAATSRHPEAPAEVEQLEFFIGRFAVRATFESPDGSKRHTDSELEGRYILSGFGIEVVEVHTPDRNVFPDVDSTFVTTTVYNYDTDNRQWSGASVNSLGNRKFVDGNFEDGKLVLIQEGKLFRGRRGRNRLTYFNITDDGFELQLDWYDEKTDTWNDGTYHYVATRVSP